MELWYTEKHTQDRGLTLRVKETLCIEKSSFQEMMILDTYEYGKVMILDNIIMLTEKDEFIYHEMITHLPLYTHPNPKKVLVIGGGDGGTLREVVKHPSVELAVLVEIDAMVIEGSKQYFPNVAKGFLSEKSCVIVDDGIKYLNNSQEDFDLIIIDSTDPIGPAIGLFHQEFYQSCFDCLTEDGMLVCQSETPFLNEQSEHFYNIQKNLKNVFPLVFPYLNYIPTYPSGVWSLTLASKKYSPITDQQKERYFKDNLDLGYYNDQIHQSSLVLPNFVKNQIIKD